MTPPLRSRKLVQKLIHALGRPSPTLANSTVPDSPPTWHQPTHVDVEPDSPSLLASFSRQSSLLRQQSDDAADSVHDAYDAPHADISSLPPEILARIFKDVRDAAFPAPSETVKYDPQLCLKWMNVAHVSPRWSMIAVNDPFLWTNVPLDSHPEIIRLHFERSEGLQLRIYVSSEARDLPERVLLLREQASRVMAVTQIGRNGSPLRDTMAVACLLVEEGGISMPELQELSVYSDTSNYDFGPLLRHAAALRSLAVVVYWPHVLGRIRAPQLRHLALDGWHKDPAAKAYQDLLRCIQASPLLEDISVRGITFVGPLRWEYPAAESQPIELRHLRRLHLAGNHEWILFILRPLVFDPLKTIVELDVTEHLNIGGRYVYDHSRLALPSGLGSRAENSHRWLYISRSCLQTGFDTDRATPSVIIRTPQTVSPLQGPDAHLGSDPRELENDCLRGIHTARQATVLYTSMALQLAGVRTLSFECHHGRIWTEAVRRFYGWCTEVEVLEVTIDDWTAGLCDTLFIRLDGHVFLPALQRVRVFDTNDRPTFGAATQSRLVREFQGDREKPVSVDLVWRRGVKKPEEWSEGAVSLVLDQFEDELKESEHK
ncbi:unnamed protein product [Peniophora sp. CBMAI 1063]|nr:unnamed protein product [Peniophora sp. CBMAI 1063]